LEETLYLSCLDDARMYVLLERIDADLVAATQEAGCLVCDGRLDRSDYPRKPRGGPASLGAGYEKRYSLCCDECGCRKRATPPSVRFLGRRVYLGVVVVLATALRHGTTPDRLARLRATLGVSARTLARWQAWWRETFVATRFWRAARARFGVPVAEETLPLSLLERFAGDAAASVIHLLRFLGPLTVTEGRS
jgi:hypothetical protein